MKPFRKGHICQIFPNISSDSIQFASNLCSFLANMTQMMVSHFITVTNDFTLQQSQNSSFLFHSAPVHLIPLHHVCVTAVMIRIIYQQGNEFSESIYTPQKIQLRFRCTVRPSLLIMYPAFIYYDIKRSSVPPQKKSFIISERLTDEIIPIPLIVCFTSHLQK